jgi:hypothetical protein
VEHCSAMQNRWISNHLGLKGFAPILPRTWKFVKLLIVTNCNNANDSHSKSWWAISWINEGHKNYFVFLVQINEKRLALLAHSYIITTSKQITEGRTK